MIVRRLNLTHQLKPMGLLHSDTVRIRNDRSILFYFLLFLFGSLTFAQTPADSLFKSEETTPFQKLFLYPIAKWQNISYSNDALNCQFHPSCSNYGAQAIYQKGTITGLIMTSDRIIRCNPHAYGYHKKMNGTFHKDGRLNDSIVLKQNGIPTKSPLLAAGLSMAVPGLGRVYSGRTMDGAFGFLMTGLALNAALNSIKKESIFAPLMGGAALTIYAGEVYGAYRSAKYYSK